MRTLMKWQKILRESYADGREVAELLGLEGAEAERLQKIAEVYPVLTNSYYMSLIDRDDPEDPIRKMSIPSGWEMEDGGAEDTSGEASNTVLPGMQHKYRQTALILSTDLCAMYCRHCFRKRLVGLASGEAVGNIAEQAAYVQQHNEITNVLISGGDAFLNSNGRIEQYLQAFTAIDHLDFIRFGTRTPVVIPQRISEDGELQRLLMKYGREKQIYVVTQFNHPREVTPEAMEAVRALVACGVAVRNQTVLLAGVNDDPMVLADLLRRLTTINVQPYYIFQCRPVRGVHNHFQVPLLEGCRIVDAAKGLQNGQGKTVRYVMSHPTGKIEILGEIEPGRMLFKYHQAKHAEDAARIFGRTLGAEQTWLGEDEVVSDK